MAGITVAMCCMNGGASLEAACRSAAWADELVIVDSGSTDGSDAVARQYADRFVVEPWRGFTGQRKFASELAAHDWVFFLDADEEVSPELAEQVRAISDAELDGLDIVWVQRRNWLMGRSVRAWRPDYLDRLIHRQRVTWQDEALHDKRKPSHPSRVRKLSGWIEHKRITQTHWADYFSGGRLDARLLPVARQMYARGRRVSPLGLWLRPKLAFLKFYLVKQGFLDGTLGLLVAQKAEMSTQLKYAALWAVQHGWGDQSVDSGPGGLPPADGLTDGAAGLQTSMTDPPKEAPRGPDAGSVS